MKKPIDVALRWIKWWGGGCYGGGVRWYAPWIKYFWAGLHQSLALFSNRSSSPNLSAPVCHLVKRHITARAELLNNMRLFHSNHVTNLLHVTELTCCIPDTRPDPSFLVFIHAFGTSACFSTRTSKKLISTRRYLLETSTWWLLFSPE